MSKPTYPRCEAEQYAAQLGVSVQLMEFWISVRDLQTPPMNYFPHISLEPQADEPTIIQGTDR